MVDGARRRITSAGLPTNMMGPGFRELAPQPRIERGVTLNLKDHLRVTTFGE
jgi:hypothetical protein